MVMLIPKASELTGISELTISTDVIPYRIGIRLFLPLHHIKETTPLARMTGRTGLVHFDKETVGVAISSDLKDLLHVATGLALSPQGLPGTGPETGSPLL